MKRIGEYNEDNVTGWFERQTPLGLFMKIIGGLIICGLIFGAIGWAGDWFSAGKKVIGVENVKAQWQFAYDYNENLNAIATQWCTSKIQENNETDHDAKIQRSSQRIAIENNYARVAAEYNGRLDDAFRAKLVKPAEVPDRAPSLSMQTNRLCPGK